MKKSIFIAVLGLASAVVSYGQGFVNFANYVSSTQTFGVKYAGGPDSGLGVGPEMTAQLFFFDGTATQFSQLQPLTFSSGGNSSPIAFGLGAASAPGAIGTGAGWFSGGKVLVPGTAGDTYTFAIVATGVLNGITYTGQSGMFSGTTQLNSTSPLPNLPAGLIQQNWTVTAVPEPTTLALAGLGGLASLVALRRKKA